MDPILIHLKLIDTFNTFFFNINSYVYYYEETPKFDNTGPRKKIFARLLLKFSLNIIVLALLNLNTTTKLSCHPPMLRERGLN